MYINFENKVDLKKYCENVIYRKCRRRYWVEAIIVILVTFSLCCLVCHVLWGRVVSGLSAMLMVTLFYATCSVRLDAEKNIVSEYKQTDDLSSLRTQKTILYNATLLPFFNKNLTRALYYYVCSIGGELKCQIVDVDRFNQFCVIEMTVEGPKNVKNKYGNKLYGIPMGPGTDGYTLVASDRGLRVETH